MAQLERLVARIEADTSALRRGMNDAGLMVERSSRKINRNLQSIDRRMAGLGVATRRLTGAMGALGIAFGAREFIRAADTMTLLSARIGLVTKSTEEATEAQEALFEISQSTRQSFESTVTLYTRLARVADDFGISSQEVFDTVETVNQALLVSGASGAEAAGGLLQLSQAMGKGTLDGAELTSVLENMPRVAELIADGMGVPIGALKDLGKEGKITTRVMVDAFQTMGASVASEAVRMDRTVGQAFQQLENSFLRAIGLANDASDGMSKLAEVIDELRQAVDSEGFQTGMTFLIEALGAIATAAAKGVAQLGALVSLATDPSLENLKKVYDGSFFGQAGDVLQSTLPSGAASEGAVNFALGPGGGPFASGKPGLRTQFATHPFFTGGSTPGTSSGGGGGGAATGGGLDATSALESLMKVEREMDKVREKTEEALSAIDDAWLDSMGFQIQLIEKRRDADLEALDDLQASEEEKQRARQQIIVTADAEIAAERRRQHDELKKAQKDELDGWQEIADALKGPLKDAMRGRINDWEDIGAVAFRVLDRIGEMIIENIQAMDSASASSGGFLGNLFGGGGAGSSGIVAGDDPLGGLFKSVGGIFGGLFAGGGDPPVGRPSIVGEQGPELFVPKVDGTVIPAGQTAAMMRRGGGGGASVTVNEAPITINGSNMDPAQLQRLLAQERAKTKAEVIKAVQRSSSVDRAFA